MFGLFTGVYWPCDNVVRNQLDFGNLVVFNKSVLRRLSFLQMLACFLAFISFSFDNFVPLVLMSMVVILILAISLEKNN